MFKDCLNKFIIIFMDDILIYSKTKEEQEGNSGAILQRLAEKKRYTKFKNVNFVYKRYFPLVPWYLRMEC